MASNRVGKERILTEHGNSEITFYGNSFIAGILLSHHFICSYFRIKMRSRKELSCKSCPELESCIYSTGPTGEIVATADDKNEAILVAGFDLDKIKAKRHSWGVFRDRRPDLYKVLLTLDGSKP